MHQGGRIGLGCGTSNADRASTWQEQSINPLLQRSSVELRQVVDRWKQSLDLWYQNDGDQDSHGIQQDLEQFEEAAIIAFRSFLDAPVANPREALLKIKEIKSHVNVELVIKHPDILLAVFESVLRDLGNQVGA